MSRVITETIEARSPVAAIVINLLDYYYNAGDDIGGLYVAFADRKSR